MYRKGTRVAASSCSVLLKGYMSRCQDNATEIDLDAVIKASYMCRSCHNSYKTHHQQKGERLFEATGSPFDYVVKF